MNMKQKGFTLIELLAVIVILAIIALIATPMILNVVESARRSAAKSSALGYIDAVEKQIMINEMDDEKTNIPNGTLTVSALSSTYGVKVKGEMPYSTGTVTIQNSKIASATLKVGKYDISCTANTCTVEGTSGSSNNTAVETATETVQTPTYTAYTLGQLVQYDPVANTACTTGETCYKWRVITVGDDTTKSNIKLQMDHNLINISAWSPSDVDTGPTTALSALATATTNWHSSLLLDYTYDTSLGGINAGSHYGTLTCTSGLCTITGNATPIATNVKARMITGEEIRAITMATGASEGSLADNWTVTSAALENYFFANKGFVIGTKTNGTNENTSLSWLVENTSDGTIYDSESTINTYGDTNRGYWTLSPISNRSQKAWYIFFVGKLEYEEYVFSTNYIGIRPVIEIPKTVLS